MALSPLAPPVEFDAKPDAAARCRDLVIAGGAGRLTISSEGGKTK
jgi:RNA-binding protein YlmH